MISVHTPRGLKIDCPFLQIAILGEVLASPATMSISVDRTSIMLAWILPVWVDVHYIDTDNLRIKPGSALLMTR